MPASRLGENKALLRWRSEGMELPYVLLNNLSKGSMMSTTLLYFLLLNNFASWCMLK
jgi:hypothetical protein